MLLGAELHGVSDQGADLADRHALIPMQGMVQSLNVSVAAAVVLLEAQRQRVRAGMYERSRLHSRDYEATLFEWAHPRIAAYCRRHDRPYPALDDEGEIIEPFR